MTDESASIEKQVRDCAAARVRAWCHRRWGLAIKFVLILAAVKALMWMPSAHLGTERQYRGVIIFASVGFLAALASALCVTASRRLHFWVARLVPNVGLPKRGARWTLLVSVVICYLVLHSAAQLYYAESSANRYDLYYSVSNIILSGGATVMVAFGGWFILELVSGFFVYRQLCKHQERQVSKWSTPEESDLDQPEARRFSQAKAVRWRLESADSILLSALTVDAGNSFVKDLQDQFNKNKIVALTIDQPAHDGTYSTAVHSEFRALLHEAEVAPHPFMRGPETYVRSFEQLTRFRRIVVIVKNLDTVAQRAAPKKTQEVVEARLRELDSSGFYYVAIITRAALPADAFSEALTIAPPDDLRLENTGPAEDEVQKKLRERAVRRLANVLQPTGLRVSSVYNRHHDIKKIDITAAELKDKGLIRFGCGLIDSFFHHDAELAHLERQVISELAEHAIITGGHAVETAYLYNQLADCRRVDVKQAITRLIERKFLVDEHDLLAQMIAFRDLRLGEIAVGTTLAKAAAPYNLSLRRSALCTAAEIYRRMTDATAPNDNVADVWRGAIHQLAQKDCPLKQSALAAAGGALNAVVSTHVVAGSTDLLREAWGNADQITQKAFVDRLTARAVGIPKIPELLWELACDRQDWQPARHVLDRALCRKLGIGGAAAWYALKTPWQQIIKPRGEELRAGLSWREKLDPVWRGHQLGLIAWTLPSLLVSSKSDRADIVLMLEALEDVVAPHGPLDKQGEHIPGDNPGACRRLIARLAHWCRSATNSRRRGSGPDLPDHDVGMQIALAEGCRDASYLCLTDRNAIPEQVIEIAGRILSLEMSSEGASINEVPGHRARGASWYTRLVALQALLVAVAAEIELVEYPPESVGRHTGKARIEGPYRYLEAGLRICEKDPHPIVQEYARILGSNLYELLNTDRVHIFVGKFVWLDDNAAVSQAGGELDPQVVRILAQVVMLLNFSGASEWLDEHLGPEPQSTVGRGRMNGLVLNTLPPCFYLPCMARMAVKIYRLGMYDAPTRRKLSQSFVDRCLEESGFFRLVRGAWAAPCHQRWFGRRWLPPKGALSQVCRHRAARAHLLEFSRRPDC